MKYFTRRFLCVTAFFLLGLSMASCTGASNSNRAANPLDFTIAGRHTQAEIDQLMGTWIGPVDQPSSNIDYSAILTFTKNEEGVLQGITDYPELACDTTLVFLGEEGGNLTFRETVVTNINACLDQGTVSVRLNSRGRIEWLYRGPGARYVTARAQLSRQ